MSNANHFALVKRAKKTAKRLEQNQIIFNPNRAIAGILPVLELLGDKANVKVPTASQLAALSPDSLSIWGLSNGVYQIVCSDLLDFIRAIRFDGEPVSRFIERGAALEICAGLGILGRELGVPSIDNYIQADPKFAASVGDTVFEPLHYPERVEKMDANKAIEKYEPEIVIGGYCSPFDPTGKGGSWGDVAGFNLQKLHYTADLFIHCGVDWHTERFKKICLRGNLKMIELKAPFLFSRNPDRARQRMHLILAPGIRKQFVELPQWEGVEVL